MIIIGLGHKARQGKDAFGRFLVKAGMNQGHYIKQYAFADALKDYCRVAFGMREKNGRMLQLVGTDLFRNHVNVDIWPTILQDKLEEDKPDIAIITDVRFVNEARFIRNEMNGVTVRIQRYINQGDGYRPFIAQDRDPNHPSETELEDDKYWNYTLSNDGDLKHLESKAHDFLINEILAQ